MAVVAIWRGEEKKTTKWFNRDRKLDEFAMLAKITIATLVLFLVGARNHLSKGYLHHIRYLKSLAVSLLEITP